MRPVFDKIYSATFWRIFRIIHTVPSSLAIFQSHLLSHLSVCIQVVSDGPADDGLQAFIDASGRNLYTGIPEPLQNPGAEPSSSSTDRVGLEPQQPPAEPPAAADSVAAPHAQVAFYEACRACERSGGRKAERSYEPAAAILRQVLCLLTEDRLTRIRMHSTSDTLFVYITVVHLKTCAEFSCLSHAVHTYT